MVTKEIVILLHCLAGSPLLMIPIERDLSHAGYQVFNVGYPSRKKDISTLADEVQQKIQSWYNLTDVTMHFVTYSLGGIILRSILAKNSPKNIGKVVMLAPPNQGSPVVDKLKNQRWFKWFFGPAAQQLDSYLPQILPHVQTTAKIGIIAGSKHYFPLFNALLPKAHDGLLGIEHTKLANMADHLVLPTSHLFIAYHPAAFKQIKYFLKNGKFNHAG